MYSTLSLIPTPGDVENCSPYHGLVLTGLLSIEKALKGTKKVFVIAGVCCMYVFDCLVKLQTSV